MVYYFQDVIGCAGILVKGELFSAGAVNNMVTAYGREAGPSTAASHYS